jgi:hypothetical protein
MEATYTSEEIDELISHGLTLSNRSDILENVVDEFMDNLIANCF